MFCNDNVSFKPPLFGHPLITPQGVLIYCTTVPDANPLVDNCTEYVVVLALVLINAPSQPGLNIVVPVVLPLETKLTVVFGLLFVVMELVIVGPIVGVAVYPVQPILNNKFMLTVTPAGSGLGETLIDQVDVLVNELPTETVFPCVRTKLTL